MSEGKPRRELIRENMENHPFGRPIGLGIPGVSGDPEADNAALRVELAAANAAYQMVCEAILPGMRNNSAAAMSIAAKLLHKRAEDAEKKTAERIAAWLDIEAEKARVIANHGSAVGLESVASRIREGEWKR